MKNVIFFGDSFTSGENNNDISFVDYYSGCNTCICNLGISGTTIGEYSIYPVDGNSLISLIDKNRVVIERADVIYLEYGINDVTAIMSGFVTDTVVRVSFVKAIDAIRQINNTAPIKFLSLSMDYDIIMKYAEMQCKYLTEDYFYGFNINISYRLWANYYYELMKVVSKRVDVVPMINVKSFLDEYISEDGIHPDNTGHKLIALSI